MDGRLPISILSNICANSCQVFAIGLSEPRRKKLSTCSNRSCSHSYPRCGLASKGLARKQLFHPWGHEPRRDMATFSVLRDLRPKTPKISTTTSEKLGQGTSILRRTVRAPDWPDVVWKGKIPTVCDLSGIAFEPASAKKGFVSLVFFLIQSSLLEPKNQDRRRHEAEGIEIRRPLQSVERVRVRFPIKNILSTIIKSSIQLPNQPTQQPANPPTQPSHPSIIDNQ